MLHPARENELFCNGRKTIKISAYLVLNYEYFKKLERTKDFAKEDISNSF
jgi:hypothetical protein